MPPSPLLSACPLRSRSAGRGYTAIEVLLAITVLMIGAAGVMTMQKASIQSNLDARKLDIANSIAHTWLERLATDATGWTGPVQKVTTVNNITNTTWLAGNLGTGNFFLPPVPGGYPAAEGKSPAFDILGRDLDLADAPNAIFCTHVKIDPIANNPNLLPGNPDSLLRATVIVFWKKQLVQSAGTPAGNCTKYFDVAADEAANPGTWHIVYAVTGVRKNPVL
jgi:type II secretory pathway pseudopilin PulG